MASIQSGQLQIGDSSEARPQATTRRRLLLCQICKSTLLKASVIWCTGHIIWSNVMKKFGSHLERFSPYQTLLHFLAWCMPCAVASNFPSGWFNVHQAQAEEEPRQRGIGRYIKRRKLEALDTYVPAVLAARSQLETAGSKMSKLPISCLPWGRFRGDCLQALSRCNAKKSCKVTAIIFVLHGGINCRRQSTRS